MSTDRHISGHIETDMSSADYALFDRGAEALERIADALERIAAAQERVAGIEQPTKTADKENTP